MTLAFSVIEGRFSCFFADFTAVKRCRRVDWNEQQGFHRTSSAVACKRCFEAQEARADIGISVAIHPYRTSRVHAKIDRSAVLGLNLCLFEV